MINVIVDGLKITYFGRPECPLQIKFHDFTLYPYFGQLIENNNHLTYDFLFGDQPMGCIISGDVVIISLSVSNNITFSSNLNNTLIMTIKPIQAFRLSKYNKSCSFEKSTTTICINDMKIQEHYFNHYRENSCDISSWSYLSIYTNGTCSH